MPSSLPICKKAAAAAPGRLYVVATPIGNLEDITLRALKVLADVDLIAAEDTRHTLRLLKTHGIGTRMVSCHQHNEAKRTVALIDRLQSGENIALVTNAGTPLLSDPGYRLVCAAVADRITVIPIPGACAAITALSAAGLPTDTFIFIGFPARKKAKRLQQLKDLSAASQAMIFYQSPHRLIDFLAEARAILGDRPAVLARELTKLHEEFLRGSLSEIIAGLGQRETVKGECTLIVAGTAVRTEPPVDALEKAVVNALEHRAGTLSMIAKTLAPRFGMSRRTVYEKALALQSDKNRKDRG